MLRCQDINTTSVTVRALRIPPLYVRLSRHRQTPDNYGGTGTSRKKETLLSSFILTFALCLTMHLVDLILIRRQSDVLI
jgi:hypothetical protein